MPYILKHVTKTSLNLREFYEHTKQGFPTKLRLGNSFFMQKLERKLF